MRRIDPALIRIAERQHGLVARRQALSAGVSAPGWLSAGRSVGWEHVSEGVLRREGAPRTPSQQALAEVLQAGPDAYLCHGSAAAAWGHPGHRLVDPVEVMALRTRSRRTQTSERAVVHHPRHLPDPFATVIDGIPVVRPALLVLQLAGRYHPERLRRLVDWFWSRRLLSGPSLAVELEPVLGRGRPGTRAVRELLASFPPGYVPAASNLEARFSRIATDHDLPRFRRQVDLGSGEMWTGRVDFVAVDRPLVVEINSELHHTALTDREHDRARRRRLEAAGFTVVDVVEHDVWHRPQAVAVLVREAWWRTPARAA